MNANRSVYIIKPEGMRHRMTIRRMIHDAGLIIERVAEVERIPDPVLTLLYFAPSLITEQAWEKMVEYMTRGPCEIGLVTGKNAMLTLLRVSGEKVDPRECAPDTIRYRFGTYKPVILDKNYLYYRNIIHRPKTKDEVQQDYRLLRQFF